MSIYESTKDAYVRNLCLRLLYNKSFPALRDFFVKAYKKARYLDMKMACIRGAANFLSEQEIASLMAGFVATLIKRPEKTPYNYQEYEGLLGQNALPYLVEKYGYEVFRTALRITRENYDRMPDAFKGHYTIDADGKLVLLRTTQEAGRMMDEFFAKQREKGIF